MNSPDELSHVRRRSFLPRFGLRTALIVAVVFCLLMGWVGRNAYRMRQEDAAIETLKRAHATIYLGTGEDRKNHPATPHPLDPLDLDSLPSFWMRLLGLSGPGEVTFVHFHDDLPKDEALDPALAALARFPTLEGIEFSGTAFTRESLDALEPLENLRDLSIFSTKITGDELAQIDSPRRFRSLRLSGVAPHLTEALAPMTELRDVQMYDMPASRADMEAIASLPHLDSLNLLMVRVSEDDFYAPLSKAQGLKKLFVASSSLDDTDMSTIGKLTRLERLEVAGITDAGLAELHSLKNLRWIDFKKPVTLDAVREFSAAHPGCVVTGWGAKRKEYYLAGEKIDSGAAVKFYEAAASAED